MKGYLQQPGNKQTTTGKEGNEGNEGTIKNTHKRGNTKSKKKKTLYKRPF